LNPDYDFTPILSVYPVSTDPVMDTIVGLIAFLILEGGILFLLLQTGSVGFRK